SSASAAHPGGGVQSSSVPVLPVHCPTALPDNRGESVVPGLPVPPGGHIAPPPPASAVACIAVEPWPPAARRSQRHLPAQQLVIVLDSRKRSFVTCQLSQLAGLQPGHRTSCRQQVADCSHIATAGRQGQGDRFP